MMMKSRHLLAVAAVLLVSSSRASSSRPLVQTFLREPFDQTAIVGAHVTLPCRVVNKVGELQWTRDDFGLGSDRALKWFDRYSMTGSDEEGDYTLDINPVQLEDDARFQCQVGAAVDVEPIRSVYVNLTVLVPPQPPSIFPSGDVYKTKEGDLVELRCESRGGKPAAEITWFDEFNTMITRGVQTEERVLEDGKRFTTVSKLRLNASVEHNNRSFTCQAQNSAIREPQTTSIRLQVHYPPHLTLSQVKASRDSSETVLEGDTARFRCEAVANPSRVSFEWFVGGKREDGPHIHLAKNGLSSELALSGVDRRLNGLPVRCLATNSIGRTEVERSLQVSYSPVFLARPEPVAGMPGERVSLTCRVDANPLPEYTWIKNGVALGSGSKASFISRTKHQANLTVVVTADAVGEYTCQAEVEGHSKVEAKAKVYMKGPPVISPAAASASSGQSPARPRYVSHASEGDVGILVCSAFSVPRSEVVEWRFKNRIISDEGRLGLASNKYSVLEEETEDGVRSTLRVRQVSEDDFGSYECLVKNAFGQDQAVFHLRKQNAMPLLVVIVGALGGVILTLALILGVILCRRHFLQSDNNNKPGGGKRKGKNLPGDILSITATTVKHKITSNGAVMDSDVEDTKGSSTSSSTGSTASDGVSNNSSEMKVLEVRASSSLSEVTTATAVTAVPRRVSDWGEGSSEESAYKPYTGNSSSSPNGDPYSQYYHNLVQASSAYFGGSPTYPSSSSPRNPNAATVGLLYPPPPNNLRVRASPPTSGSEETPQAPPPPSYNNTNTSFDYVPASAILAGQPAVISNYRGGASGSTTSPHIVDNYSVYVNGNLGPASSSPSNASSQSQPTYYQHEVVVPVHEKPSSLATHV